MHGILTVSEAVIILDPLKNINFHDWERKKCSFYFIAYNLLCNNSVIFFLCDSYVVLRWIGSCRNILKNAV